MVFFSPSGLPLQNPYTLLNVTPLSCTDDDIAKAFKKLMLQLHPDKQPVNQSPADAELVAIKLHDVMDAKSFLLDGEHLAAKREYDAKLIKESQQPQPQPPQSPSRSATTRQKKSSANQNVKKSTANNTKSTSPEVTHKPKNVHVKQWGKVNRPDRAASTSNNKKTQSSTAANNNSNKNNVQRRRTTSEEKVSSTKPVSVSDHNNQKNKRKTHTRTTSVPNNNISSTTFTTSKSATTSRTTNNKTPSSAAAATTAFDDSCGDCSTTDDCSFTSDDVGHHKQHHVQQNMTNKIPCSNRPSAGRGLSWNNIRLPRPSVGSVSKQRSESILSSKQRSEKKGATPKKLNQQQGGVSAANKSKRTMVGDDTAPSQSAQQHQQHHQQPATTVPSNTPASTSTAPANNPTTNNFSTFYPAINILEKQYHCPLTKELMKEPMSDIEGNSYERSAILAYLESNSTSPVTGKPLTVLDLTLNTALREKIRYTIKLKSCLNTLQMNTAPPPQPSNAPNKPQVQHQQKQHQSGPSSPRVGGSSNEVSKYKSLREAVDSFITELNSLGSSSSPQQQVTISQLDNWGITSFTYHSLKFRLEVPSEGLSNNILIQTWYENTKKATSVSTRVTQFNTSLQKIGIGGKLTFRNMRGQYALTLTKPMDLQSFSKSELRHGIEYFVEMSIKIHNIIHGMSNDRKIIPDGKVRLGSGVAT